MTSTIMTPIPAVVINLDERKDRWQWIQEQLREIKTLSIERFSAIKHKKGYMGCLLSHQSIVRYAYEHNYEMVLVLEDDCQLCDDFDQRFPPVLDWLMNHRSEWDTFNGGPAFTKFYKGISLLNKNPPILKTNGRQSQFVIYNRSCFETILKAGDGDRIDVYINHNCRQVTTVPLLSTQLPSKSNICRIYINYTPFYKIAERKMLSYIK